MAASTTVNGRTVVHRTSGGTLATFPDVCLTPAPGGPVPVPYPNVARSADLAGGTQTVTVDGSPVAVEDSVFGRSTGDEPGTQKGVLSQAQGGEARFLNWSFDVKIEGKGVCRLLDPMASNGGSPTNTPPAGEVQPPLVVPPVPDPDLDPLYRVHVVFLNLHPDAVRPGGRPAAPSFSVPLRFTGPENETWSPLYHYSGAQFNVWNEGDYEFEFEDFDLTRRALLPADRARQVLDRADAYVRRQLENAKRIAGNAVEDLGEARGRFENSTADLYRSAGDELRLELSWAQERLDHAATRAVAVQEQLGEALAALDDDWATAAAYAKEAAREAGGAARDAARAIRDLGEGLDDLGGAAAEEARVILRNAVRALEEVGADIESATLGS